MEVITTTMRICGCSCKTSMWRIVVVPIGGAQTIASRLVTCDSVSVVTRIASSTSRRTKERRSSAERVSGSRRST